MGIFGKLLKPNIEKLKKDRDIEGLIKACEHKDKFVNSSAEKALNEIIKECEAARDLETLFKIIIPARERGLHSISILADIAYGNIQEERKKIREEGYEKSKQHLKNLRASLYPFHIDAYIKELLKIIKDAEWTDVHEEAIKYLGDIQDERAVEPLIEILHEGYGAKVLTSVAHSLGSIRDKRAVEPLSKVLRNIRAVQDRETVVYWQAIVGALEQIEENSSVEPLIEILKNENESQSARKQAAGSLRWRRDKRVVEALIDVLKNTAYRDVREAIIDTLGSIGDERAVEPLREVCLSRYEGGLPIAAVRALGQIYHLSKDKRARESAARALREACDRSEDPSVAKEATETLEFRKEMPY